MMERQVSIKGVPGGLTLTLQGDTPYMELRNEIARCFFNASSFLGEGRVGLVVKGRELEEDQAGDIFRIIEANTDLEISCLLYENRGEEAYFSLKTGERETLSSMAMQTRELTREERFYKSQLEEKKKALDMQRLALSEVMSHLSCEIVRTQEGDIASGQSLHSEYSLLILGDVEASAEIYSGGSLFVLGKLYGKAYCGSSGDSSARIFALEFFPQELSIAGVKKNFSGEEGTIKNYFFEKKKGKKKNIYEPTLAWLSDKGIKIKAYSEH